MIITKLSGGLGNQMFQYAFGRALSIRNKTEFKLDLSNYRSNKEQRVYVLGVFGISTPLATFWERLTTKKILEKNSTYDAGVTSLVSGLFTGNWQSEKYFSDFADTIRKDFELKNVGQKYEEHVASLETKKTQGETSVSIHVRRGDYATDARTLAKHGLLPIDYFVNAMNTVKGKVKDAHFYIFSDDIDWIRKHFNLSEKITFVSKHDMSDAEQLILMSKCEHNIIANSSYSWWAAWLNANKNKIVIAPKEWFKTIADTTDLIPSSWLRI